MADDRQREVQEKIARAAREAARTAPRGAIEAALGSDSVPGDTSAAGGAAAVGRAREATIQPVPSASVTVGAGSAALAAGMAPPTLNCQGVSQRYPLPRGGFQTVLNDIEILVPGTEFISVVGPSGCGKSTLLRLVLGSEAPWKGTVTAGGRPVERPDRHRGIVFQRYSLFPHLTVLENVVFGLELDGTWLLQKWLTGPWYRRRLHRQYVEMAMEHLRTVKLDEHAHKYPQQLSGGMQQRVAIAQALVMKPKILLMDEPFGALDPGTREALQLAIVESFRENGVSILFVTHDLEEALFVGTRVIVLSQHWRNSDGSAGEGARVVMDVRCPKSTALDVKGTAEFQELLNRVRRAGFDPGNTQRPESFDRSAAPKAGAGQG